MDKRGQMTIFVIVGIVIVAAILVIISLSNRAAGPQSSSIAPEVQPIAELVEHCLEDTTKDAIHELGKTGGFYPPKKTDTTLLDIPYYVYEGVTLMPTKQDMQQAFNEYYDEHLDDCLNGYEALPEFTITTGQRAAHVSITSTEIHITYDFVHTIQRGDTTYTIETFTHTQPSRFGTLYDVAAYLTEQQEVAQGATCLTCVVDMTLEHDIKIITTETDDGSVIYAMTAPEEIHNDAMLMLFFAFDARGGPNIEP